METLKGKTAVVTGSSRSIGRGIAERLAARGALVAVHYATNAAAAQEVVETIGKAGGQAFAFGTELGHEGDAERFWAEFDVQRRAFSDDGDTGVDILVNNAAVALRDHFQDATVADFDRMIAVNIRAPFFIVQHALDRLRDGGRVINISSAVTRLGLPEVIAYGATKGALDSFSRILAKELGSRGITVNVVAPGYVDTDSNADWLRHDKDAWEETAAKSVFGRVGEPEDIGDAVAFLATDAGRWITGQHIDASGGTRM
ncbi:MULTISPECIES: SDR family oxidoreductase [Streptomyces]|uniref:SDR family oxidoreductase n=1 Tax=Streptomyces sindenensis TaxID=67363 RepID=A0ABW6EGV9_9ACTN|nr:MULTISPECIES: SDR family oxidoreductase [Streptomyces]WGP10275.1 SDR family oxidoreductase [Streptomyces sp. SH5]GGP65870.1 short-chain dehydrogenase [Streptomyces sindenensis]